MAETVPTMAMEVRKQHMPLEQDPGASQLNPDFPRIHSLKTFSDGNTQGFTSGKNRTKACPSQEWAGKLGSLQVSVPIKKIYSSYKSCSILKEGFLFFHNSSPMFIASFTQILAKLIKYTRKVLTLAGQIKWQASSPLGKILVLLMPTECCCWHRWGPDFTSGSPHTQFLIIHKRNVMAAWSYLKI